MTGTLSQTLKDAHLPNTGTALEQCLRVGRLAEVSLRLMTREERLGLVPLSQATLEKLKQLDEPAE